ncbi:unnamed protein product [Lactuca virosa]|uniref:Uncharacterized protein n=1 Tax=Lactuca virosa TaxID=75947 RepID=A0AAU9MJ58_9ASTR|nr:unnamed protein product [Lactuca virosa]
MLPASKSLNRFSSISSFLATVAEWVIDQVVCSSSSLTSTKYMDFGYPEEPWPTFHYVPKFSDEDLGMHSYKSKLNELHRENMELFKENINLSKNNMDLEKENLVLQKELMKLKVNDKQEPDIFLWRLMM